MHHTASRAKLSVAGVGKRYGALDVLKDCAFEIEAGTITSIVGPSGSGKTTLLWAMSGLHAISEGEICLDGVPIRGPHPQIGIVFQEANLLPWRTLASNVRLPYEFKGTPVDQPWIDHLMERCGLRGFEQHYPREMSGGMQQRASIVRALSQRPQVLFMDEPFGALDAFTREEMNRLVEEIYQETRTTIVFITHSIEEAIFLSDRILVLSARPGRVFADYAVDLPRPRDFESMASQAAFDLTHAIKSDIYGQRGAAQRTAR